ncbi:hypothetical protein IWX49DRAFT_566182 [Phyllosticta citricarpa]
MLGLAVLSYPVLPFLSPCLQSVSYSLPPSFASFIVSSFSLVGLLVASSRSPARSLAPGTASISLSFCLVY